MTKQVKADLMLLMITVFWGASYMLTKLGLGGLEPFNLTAIRFIIAFIIAAVVFYKKILSADKKTIKYAFILGILLLGMFVSMTFGLKYTTASNAGFLISLSVVLIPIISLVFLKQKIEKKVIIGVCFALIGIALLTLDAQFKINIGDLLCILCALFCSIHVIVIGIFTKEVDSIALGTLQLGFAGIFSTVISLLTEKIKLPDTALSWFFVLILSIFCTAIGYIVQSNAQQFTSATHTGLILSMEPVFSAILAYIFLGEVLPARGYIGAAILLSGVIIAELDFKNMAKSNEVKKEKERTSIMNFDALNCSYSCKRYTAYGKKGMVATSQPLAAGAGVEILKKGGNAIDAAVAVAACLTVCEPTSNGIGGDAFAIASIGDKLYGLNASGPAPMGISIDKLKKQGYKEIPKYGFVPVNVPGAPAAWAALSKRFGRLSLKEVLAPAIRYAQEGYPVSVILGKNWNKAYDSYKENLKGDEFKSWFKTFAPEGRAPKIGEMITLYDHAKTLMLIAETEGEVFYRGEIAERIDAFSKQYGGYIRKEDLENYKVDWVEPIYTKYRDYEVNEAPPNGQGIVALMALNILKGFEFKEKNSVDTYHKQIEAIKLAFEDAQRYVTDIGKMKVKVEDLLSDAWADENRKRIGRNALMPYPSREQRGGTVYLATADEEGNMVSYIQSNYMGFGSGLVVPETGIALHNRGHNFSFDPNHHNALEPGKKTYHTIIPGFLTKDRKPVGPFGVMGGFMQPQGHVQVLMNLIDFNLNPQAVLDAPRWQWTQGKKVELEDTMPEVIVKGLEDMGHDVKVTEDNTGYGRGQIILRDDNGVLAGGTENRTDGTILAW